MFKHYKKLNKFSSLLMLFVMFGFFACNLHASAEASDHHQSNETKSYTSLDEKLCFDDQIKISNSQNNYQLLGLAILPNSYKIVFPNLLLNTKSSFNNLSISPPDNRLYLKNNILLI